MTLLEVEDLTVRVVAGNDWRAVVEGLSLSVGAGEICGIVGETGAGKTLATRAAIGLLPSGVRADGSVRLGGDAYGIGSLRGLLGRETGIVLQNPMTALDPMMKVGQQLCEGVLRHRLSEQEAATERAIQLLARLDFDDPAAVLELYPHQLSGGMAQRVTIAMALMPRPRLLVVDEPTSALDANVRTSVLRLLHGIVREERSAVLLVSHDLRLVGRFCDRVCVMYAGRIVEEGPASELLDAPAHPYTRALLACEVTVGATPRQRLPTIAGAPPSAGSWPPGCVYADRCAEVRGRCDEVRPQLEPTSRGLVACLWAERKGQL